MRLRRGVFLVLALCLLGIVGGDARARAPARALDHHATVLNGQIVGSAFLIAERIGVTNAHVLRGRAPGETVTLVVSGPGRERVLARVRAVSARMDLALLDVPPDLLPPVPSRDGRAAAGQRVISAGVDAGGPAWPGAPREASGDVISPRSELAAFGPGLIVRLPGARPGFSGGPLLDAEGRLIGMVTAIRGGTAANASGGLAPARSRVTVTEAFALRAADIRAEVGRLLGASPP